jgi:hypothetical protein
MRGGVGKSSSRRNLTSTTAVSEAPEGLLMQMWPLVNVMTGTPGMTSSARTSALSAVATM